MISAVLNAASISLPALGLVAATTAALFWAFSVVMYRRVGRIMPPVRLNMTKGLIAVVLLSVVLAVDWLAFGHRPWSMSWGLLGLMALSGVIGIGIGDTMFFAGLNRMGARRMLLLFTVNPVITLIAAWVLMDESLGLIQILGIALTCGGVAWVIAERNAGKSDGHVDALGVVYGLGAATCQSAGYLMSRYVLLAEEMTPAASAWLRLAAGSAVLVFCLPMDRLLKNAGGQDHHHPKAPSRKHAVLMFFGALLLGTVLGIWLMQVSAKYATSAGVASTLLSTSPLFVLPIVMALGEHISRRAVIGAVVTIVGIAMLHVFAG